MSYKYFYGFGDMLIGSKIPPQAHIIKIVITGGDPRVARYCCWQRSSFFFTPMRSCWAGEERMV